MSRALLPTLNGQREAFSWEAYKTTLIGYSDNNDYIPFYSLNAHNMLVIGEQKVLEYALPITSSTSPFYRNYQGLIQSLTRCRQPSRYLYKLSNLNYQVQIEQGLLYDNEQVYMCLGINTDYVMNTPPEALQESLDFKKFTLFIDNSFKGTPHLRNVYKNVNKLYIEPLGNSGIDIVLTTRLKEWLFKNSYVMPKFKSVMEMKKHLKDDIPNLIIE